jgi:hypothetical protein
MAVRGQVQLHFDDVSDARHHLLAADFDHVQLWAPEALAQQLPGMDAPGAGRVRVVEAVTGALPD